MNNADTTSKGIYSMEMIPQQLPKNIQRIMELEGQCQIVSIELLKTNAVKTVFMMIFLIATFFGLLVLKYSAKFRKFIFYEKCNLEQATHLFIKGKTANDDIVPLQTTKTYPIKFSYKKLRYFLNSQNKVIPRALNIEDRFEQFVNSQKIRNGLSDAQVLYHRELYGSNQHNVEIPNYFAYLLDVLTSPYFLLQYFFCLVFFLQGYAPFSITLLAFTILTATINYILLYISYRKIKSIAQQTFEVSVIRNRVQQKILNTELVPGDIYIPKHEIPADSFIIQGDIFVNEANLTGQSHPIGKFPIKSIEQIKNSSVWLYEGSKIVDETEDTRAIVVNTNFATHRGRIIRRILHRQVKDPQIIRSLLFVTIEIVLFSLIVFFATLPILLSIDIQPLFRFFKFIDFLASSAPPPLPIYFNIAYGFSLTRLRYKGIIGTEPQKTVDGAQVKTFCFDKTGTLTQSKVRIRKLFKLENNSLQEINLVGNSAKLSQENSLIWKLFSCCHTTRIIDGEILGDEIDKEIFIFSGTEIFYGEKSDVKFRISKKQKPEKPILQVLRINQFESKFQSNSVLVFDLTSKKYFIFVKGAPEKINLSSTNSTNLITDEVRNLSLEGLRTIAIAYKQIAPEDLERYLNADRNDFQIELTMLGLVAFENHLKTDTVETIQRLRASNIDPKIITGDNIYIAVETARRAGIIKQEEKVLYFRGSDQNFSSLSVEENMENTSQNGCQRTFRGVILNERKEEEFVEVKQKEGYLNSGFVYAIDNAFFQLDAQPFLTHQIRVFARISAQNKAEIIRTYKKQDKIRRQKSLNCFLRLLKYDKLKVGMCGDGANDLLALKQADLSVGIQETDASYGSSFTITNLLSVEHLIREAKCVQSNILELFQFYIPMTMTILLVSIFMIADTTYLSTAELMYLNFASVLLISVCLTMSMPAINPVNTAPDPNALNLHNHLIVWGHTLIPFLGALGAYLYFSNTDEYQPNPQPRARIQEGGFNSQNHTATLCFLMFILISPVSGFLIYRSSPYKRRIWRNPLLSIVIVLNLTVALIFPFFTRYLNEAFEIVEISLEKIGVCLGIMLGTLIILVIYNLTDKKIQESRKIIRVHESRRPDCI